MKPTNRASAISADETELFRKLREERDRFVAFAFCDADILIELTPADRICFAAGATSVLLGVPPESLAGRPVIELFAPDCRLMVQELLRILGDGHRLEPVFLRLQGKTGPTPPLTLIGYKLTDLDRHCFLALRLGQPMTSYVPPVELPRDAESGLISPQGVEQLAKERARSLIGKGQDCTLTVLNFDEFDILRQRMNVENRRQMMGMIGAWLKANSLYGDSAARFDDDSFGLLHGPSTNIGNLESRIEQTVRNMDPDGKGVVVRSVSVALDYDGLSEGEAVDAFVYAVESMVQAGSDPRTMGTLSDGFAEHMQNAGRRIAAFRKTVAMQDFDIAFHPVVELATRKPRYYEVLARFVTDGRELSPAEVVHFAERVGLATDFDLAMCRRALQWLYSGPGRGKGVVLSVNLSAQSVHQTEFVGKLQRLLEDYPDAPHRLSFEVRETALTHNLKRAIPFIQKLRSRGFKVCVDGFGAGPSAFHNLRQFDIDGVKIHSSYARDALALPNGRAFLKAIAGLCKDLGIVAIAEVVEDEQVVPLLEYCGIEFGQGFLFGHPTADPFAGETAAQDVPGWSEVSWSVPKAARKIG